MIVLQHLFLLLSVNLQSHPALTFLGFHVPHIIKQFLSSWDTWDCHLSNVTSLWWCMLLILVSILGVTLSDFLIFLFWFYIFIFVLISVMSSLNILDVFQALYLAPRMFCFPWVQGTIFHFISVLNTQCWANPCKKWKVNKVKIKKTSTLVLNYRIWWFSDLSYKFFSS